VALNLALSQDRAEVEGRCERRTASAWWIYQPAVRRINRELERTNSQPRLNSLSNPTIEGGNITPPMKLQAMRLALYLDSVQQTPNVSGNNYREYVMNLTRQFQQLAAEQRKDAKRLGRMRIR
jgi:hypothetical protein